MRGVYLGRKPFSRKMLIEKIWSKKIRRFDQSLNIWSKRFQDFNKKIQWKSSFCLRLGYVRFLGLFDQTVIYKSIWSIYTCIYPQKFLLYQSKLDLTSPCRFETFRQLVKNTRHSIPEHKSCPLPVRKVCFRNQKQIE